GQAQHAARDAGGLQLFVAVAPLRRQDRHADQALDAAEAGGALDDLQPIVHALGTIVAALEIERDHAPKAGHLALGDLVVGVRRQPGIVHAADATIVGEKSRDGERVRVVLRNAQRERLQTPSALVHRLRIHTDAYLPPTLLNRR